MNSRTTKRTELKAGLESGIFRILICNYVKNGGSLVTASHTSHILSDTGMRPFSYIATFQTIDVLEYFKNMEDLQNIFVL